MKTRKVKSESTKNTYIDSETGEILDTDKEIKHHKIVVDGREAFAMMYSSVIGAIEDMDRATVKVLVWCSLNTTYNSNIISLTKPMCNQITKDYSIQYNTIKNCITKLKRRNILIPLGSGTYRVNPKYFWKGESNKRRETMKYVLEVECKNAND